MGFLALCYSSTLEMRQMSDNVNDNEICGSINFSTDVILQPWDADPQDYSMEIKGNITAFDEHGTEVKVGDLTMNLFMVSDAIHNKVPLGFVFDAMALDDLWAKLFVDDDFASELEILAPGQDVLFIDKLTVDPTYRDIGRRAVQTAISTFCPLGVTVAHFSLLGDIEWNQLGFKPLPKTEYVYWSDFG